jgi:glucose-6-phosphate 1-epimerase
MTTPTTAASMITATAAPTTTATATSAPAGVGMTEFGSLPALSIAGADGARAIITLFGAQLVSWRPADGRERLFCGARTALDGGAAIRGGVPVIFPQFATRGAGRRHGFARLCHWRLTGIGEDGADHFAELSLTPAELPAAIKAAWPFAFALRLRVTLRAGGLDLTLDVDNPGPDAFAFAAALHSYYLIDELERTTLEGLGATQYTDAGQVGTRDEAPLRLGDNPDRIYGPAPSELTLRDGAGALRLEQEGFPEVVVWNPGLAGTAALADLDDGEYRRFVCVEPARVDPRPLAAGAAWRGVQRIRLA